MAFRTDGFWSKDLYFSAHKIIHFSLFFSNIKSSVCYRRGYILFIIIIFHFFKILYWDPVGSVKKCRHLKKLRLSSESRFVRPKRFKRGWSAVVHFTEEIMTTLYGSWVWFFYPVLHSFSCRLSDEAKMMWLLSLLRAWDGSMCVSSCHVIGTDPCVSGCVNGINDVTIRLTSYVKGYTVCMKIRRPLFEVCRSVTDPKISEQYVIRWFDSGLRRLFRPSGKRKIVGHPGGGGATGKGRNGKVDSIFRTNRGWIRTCSRTLSRGTNAIKSIYCPVVAWA